MASIINSTTTAGVTVTGDNSGSLQLATNNGTTAVTIDTSQNVGIGTSSFTHPLTVKKSNAADWTCKFSNSAANGISGFGYYDNSDTWKGYVGYDNGDVDFLKLYGTTGVGIKFLTATTERMRITSGGSVGIATSSPTSGLEVYRATSTTGSLTDASLMLSTTATTGRKVSIGFGLGGGVANTCAANIGYDVTNGAGAGLGDIYFSTRNTTADSTPTERMRINSSGQLLIGSTSLGSANLNSVGSSAVRPQINIYNTDTGSTAQGLMEFFRNAVFTGGINNTGTTTAYTTSSDYRLKENIAPMTGALAKVSQLKPCTYTWKATGETSQGFIAHELQEIVPDCVSGTKDQVETYLDEDGNEQTRIKPQGIDTSFLVATLTAAIQELKAELDATKAEVQALKGVA